MYRSKKVLMLLTVLIFSASSLFGQLGSATESADVLIKIKPSLSLAVQGSIDFGQTSTAGTEVVTPDKGARFQVLGHDTGDIIVSFANAILSNLNGDILTFTPDVVYTGASNTYVAGTSHTSGNPVTMVDSDNDGTGEVFLFVGGDIEAAGAPQGDYTGSFSLTVAYN